jgi:protoporphyrinogen oxidase
VVVIGGGLAGLAAAYDLVKGGAHVTILESGPTFGGLASSFRLEGVPIERFYHFICGSDDHLVRLVGELGLEAKLRWHPTSTAFFYEGRFYPFGTPSHLLRFAAVPPAQRLRFGLHVLRSRYREEWRELDRIPAKSWLIESIGREAYEVIWHPLLKVKFGDEHDQISAAWIWHRIWRVARSRKHVWTREEFGYLEHGTATLVDALVAWFEQQPNARLVTGAKVEPFRIEEGRVTEVRTIARGGRAEERFACDSVVSTVAPPQLDRLVSSRADPYFEKIRAVRYIGVVCTLLSLDRPFGPHFWTNINDRRISFNGVIEQTNLNANLRGHGLNVAYIPFYLPTDDPRYTASDEALVDEYVPMLKLIRPDFRPEWIKEAHVFRAPYAQALFVRDFAHQGLVPAHKSSLDNLFVTDSTQFYPEDRTLSAAIDQGRKVAAMILTERAQRG